MGTRGVCGFRLHGTDYLTYNHFDSYPSGLGNEMIRQWNTYTSLSRDDALPGLALLLASVKVVDEAASPTAEEAERLKPYHENVSSGGDFYSYLRGLQGNPIAMVASGFWIDSTAFVKDSLFCEWGYVYNLDDNVFEVYRGFNTKAKQAGRYCKGVTKPKGWKGDYKGATFYYPVKLVRTFPLDELPDDLDAILELEEE
jgi:hypothetical protein